MQDRYAGDIGDYGEIGLLRELQARGLSVGINWYRVDPLEAERKIDGTFKQADGKYLIPDSLKVCDGDLAQQIFSPELPGAVIARWRHWSKLILYLGHVIIICLCQ